MQSVFSQAQQRAHMPLLQKFFSPLNASQREWWPVAHHVKLVLREGSKRLFSEGACDT